MSTLATQALESFSREVNQKLQLNIDGEPEDQLRAPVEKLVTSFSTLVSPKSSLVMKGESRVRGVGRPDYAVSNAELLVGYMELKALGKGVDDSSFRGHDRSQFENFKRLPNLIYTDGNEWRLFQQGEEVQRVFLSENPRELPAAFSTQKAAELQSLFSTFLMWEPIVPGNPSELAAYIAPLCRLLKEEVAGALRSESSSFRTLHKEWRRILFPRQGDEEFADAYAQTLTYALLLARVEGADALSLGSAKGKLGERHAVLQGALDLITQREAMDELGVAVGTLQRVIQAVDRSQFAQHGVDTWLYFYEDFLKAYDPELRKKFGVYYTPKEVVNCQVRLVEDLLMSPDFGKKNGFAEESVITLDPAAGTGTYLLGVFRNAVNSARLRYGEGMVPQLAERLAKNLHGFEMLVGPYSVASLRLSEAILDAGANLPKDGIHLYLCDTLESPNSESEENLFVQALSEEHKRAKRIKSQATPVVVCIGNPPYLRHEKFSTKTKNYSVTGGWVRHGDYQLNTPDPPIIESFIAPVKKAKKGGQLKNLYNLYVYFWRFAIWKVFEQNQDQGGIISFITASSYLKGDAFLGMREMLALLCDEIYILDLGGEGRGSRQEENVFDIQTPVAILFAVRRTGHNRQRRATVKYVRIEGDREKKLEWLESKSKLEQIDFTEVKCVSLSAVWVPQTKGEFGSWPLLTDLMPWQHSGVQFKRTWPIGISREVLEKRWDRLALVPQEKLNELFVATDARSITATPVDPVTGHKLPSILESLKLGNRPTQTRYSYRSFDRQHAFPDLRFADRPRPVLWQSMSENQLFLATLTSTAIGNGPGITVFHHVPDLDCFRGSYGAKSVVPLYREADDSTANITQGVLDQLSLQLGHTVTPEDFVCYLLGTVGTSRYTALNFEELTNSNVRVPLTKDINLFREAIKHGRKIIWLQTFGERFLPANSKAGEIPLGTARCISAVSAGKEHYPNAFSYDPNSHIIRVGDGEFGPVAPEIWNFEVSGLKVVSSWLGYRMKERRGRTSSELDKIYPDSWGVELTQDFLELLWVLEATLEAYQEAGQTLDKILSSDLFTSDEFSQPTELERKPPQTGDTQGDLFGSAED